MKKIYLAGVLTLLCTFVVSAQNRINFKAVKNTTGFDLSKKFKQYQLLRTDLDFVFKLLDGTGDQRVELVLSDQLHWTFDLTENALLAANYTETVVDGKGVRRKKSPTTRTYTGSLRGSNGRISLAVDHGFFFSSDY